MDISYILETMSTYHLSAEEYLFVYMVFLCQREENNGSGHTIYFVTWYQQCDGENKLHDIFVSLKQKGIIEKDCNPTGPQDIVFTNSFIKGFLRHSDILGQELWNEYPDYKIIGGERIRWKNITGGYSKLQGQDDFFFFYGKEINHDLKLHNKIIELVKWAKQNNLIHFSIREFVASHKWEELERLQQEGNIGGTVDSVMIYE